MNYSWKHMLTLLSAILWIAGSLIHPAPADSSCSVGAAVPPFLAAGVDPNLLLMIDNSASMYDLAYVKPREKGYCYDGTYTEGGSPVESYDAATGYVGYFDAAGWYAYNFMTEKFEETLECTTADYINSGTVCIDINESVEPKEVTAFAATGNFLNWASASKLDIQKKILTGGKYDTVSGLMVMESRGCLGRRFVKKIGVKATSGDLFYLTLGIRPPNDDEKGLNADDNMTRIEIFEVTKDGFNYDACQSALKELDSDDPKLGDLKGYVDDCMGYKDTNPLSVEATSMAAFNHSLQECWFYNKNGYFQPGSGTVSSLKNDCEKLYKADIDPESITTEDNGYICYGQYGPVPPDGYVGRCWEPAIGGVLECVDRKCSITEPEPASGAPEICKPDGYVYYCSGNYNAQKDTCNKDWLVKQNCTGGGDLEVEGWTNDDDDDPDGPDACVKRAIEDYCGTIQVPQVIDPSDAADDTGEIWNAPAVLIDHGVKSQLNKPLAVLKGHIVQAAAPSGLIEKYADKIRMGVMIFNDDGSDSEWCSAIDPYDSVLYNCPDGNRDGGKIISYIDQSAAHTTDLINAINDIKATSWTPLAESIYNAVMYYTQNDTLRLDAADFMVDASHDPITAYCQNNNILVITEGASTADLNSDVSSFVATAGKNDGDTETSPCGDLAGSTYLDDLTYYAWQGTDIYGTGITNPNQNIMTHIVIAGAMRAGGTGECNPETLLTEAAANGGTSVYQANNPADLQAKLEAAFASIREGAAAGSAASVISASRGGEGAIYQAIFWPKVEIDNADPVEWIGEVHAMHIDAHGQMYEDTNGDRTLDAGDAQVVFYYDTTAERTKACVNPTDPYLICSGTSKDLDEVRYMWSAGQWLAEVDAGDIMFSRGATSNYISNIKKRYIFTWNDLDNNGSVADAEVLDFASRANWYALGVNANRGPVPMDFGVDTSAEVNEIVNWVRGLDQTGMRRRQIPTNFDLDPTTDPVPLTWRLGDVVHSTPIAVSRPGEGYHYIYRDQSYASFATHYNKRRHVIYFGANDGMLHAVNGGFYDETQKKFCLTEDCTSEDTAPELGAELWAYVPYNLLPHLKCLKNLNYDHKYFVDMKPRIFDVQIFTPDADHPGGWGTILVGGMRFGGARISAHDLDMADNGVDDYGDTRQFTSAFFIFDVTNPEKAPTLLGEMTFDPASSMNLGFTTTMPTVVPMKTGADTSEWYLVMGSGPTTLDGTSTQEAKVAVFRLKNLTTNPRGAFQIPDSDPTAPNETGRFLLSPAANNGFVSDFITVDFDLVENYRADVIYFGTVEGTWGNWGGKVYRLVTHGEDGTGAETASKPSDWAGLLTASSLDNPMPLIDVGRPVTAAPAIGWDGKYRWVYFGTGRFFDKDDKTDAGSNAQETYYGIKEPQDCSGDPTWATVEKSPASPTFVPGGRGLVQVDQILVQEASTMVGATLGCVDTTTDCLPVEGGSPIGTFDELVHYIVGTGCHSGVSSGMDGWYKEFSAPRERNLGQATLLGGLLTFTTYQPFDDVCLPEGMAFLYGSYYQTGTAWHDRVFAPSGINVDDGGNIVDRLSIGRGLALTPNLHVGKHTGSKAFVQTSTGAIVEIPQPNLPIKNAKSGMTVWDEITD